jgi:hypothetical protein
MFTKTLTAAVLAASLSGAASAGVLTMTADTTTGYDGWESLSGYKMVLTINCSTIDAAGSSSSFTLNYWKFEAFDSTNTIQFLATGSGDGFTAAPSSGKFVATINLSTSNISLNLFVPKADKISFGYAFSNTESLGDAIAASAGTSDGLLALGGTDGSSTGDLEGMYAVPAPGAIAVLGLGGLMSRRRKA